MFKRANKNHSLSGPRTLAALAGVLAIVGGASAADFPSKATGSSNEPDKAYVEGEVLVRFAPQFTAQGRQRAVDAVGGRAEAVERANFERVRLPEGASVSRAAEKLESRPEVEAAQPNFVYQPAQTRPDDPGFGDQWGLENDGGTIDGVAATEGKDIDAPLAWDEITDCSNVTVAVIDTGVNHEHADFQGRIWTGNGGSGKDFIDGDNDPMPVDGSGHGTHVAGLIGAAGNNGTTTAGVCWQVEIMAIRSLSLAGGGTTSTIVQGIDFAVDNGADVINMSFTGPNRDQMLVDAVNRAGANDVSMVAAAGNSGADLDQQGNDTFPCEIDNPALVCIAALTPSYGLAAFSNFGAQSVHAGGPGVANLSTWPGAPVIADFSTWNFNNSSNNGWAACSDSSRMGNPQDRCTTTNTTYDANSDDHTWKEFDFSQALGAGIRFRMALDVESGLNDGVIFWGNPNGGDPTGTGSIVNLFTSSGTTLTELSLEQLCLGSATCSLGLQLTSDANSTVGSGALLGLPFQQVEVLGDGLVVLRAEPDATTSRFLQGTSMAAPHVAGVAAMLRAFNPDYTAGEVVTALLRGGEPVTALDGSTASGKAVNAMGALAFIPKPEQVSAQVQ